MNKLVQVKLNSNQEPVISGRELHEKLQVETPYTKWFSRMVEYGFEENKDFNLVKNVRVQIEGNREVTREVTDHVLTIAMAKELCMIQRNEVGKRFRQFFIKVEEEYNSPEKVMARALTIADKKIKELTALREEDAPKVLFADSVATSKTSCLIGELAKILKQNGIEMGQNRLFNWLRQNGYLICRGDDKNKPTQKSMELGLFEIKKGTYINSSGASVTTCTPKVTGKGQIYFVNKFLKRDNLCTQN